MQRRSQKLLKSLTSGRPKVASLTGCGATILEVEFARDELHMGLHDKLADADILDNFPVHTIKAAGAPSAAAMPA
jgi:hypothetical protein